MAKRIPSKYKFPDFRLLPWKLTKFLLSFFKPQVSLPLNFATPFSVMTHNSLKFSNWNISTFETFEQKEAFDVQFFRLLGALMKVHPNPHAIFETTNSRFTQILYHCLVFWKITPLYFFSSNFIYFGQNNPWKWNFWTFEWLGENSPNSPCHIWNHKLVFL